MADSTDSAQIKTDTTDWSLCVLCQEKKTENLQNPLSGSRSDRGRGYDTIASNILEFDSLNALPIHINLTRLDGGNGVAETFRINNARWHKSCKDKFSTLKLDRARKRKCASPNDTIPSEKYTRQRNTETFDSEKCFFCQNHNNENLHNASTFQLDSRVRSIAIQLQDKTLLAKLSSGDMVALEAKYHATCLVSLYNRATAQKPQVSGDDHDSKCHGIAFAELIAYIEEKKSLDENVCIFKLADLSKMYVKRLEQFGVFLPSRLRSTTLKDRILGQFPDMTESKLGRQVLLAFNNDIGVALKRAYENNYDDEGICLSKAASIVRRDMFRLKSHFTGSFHEQCQSESVPGTLLALIRMIMQGPDIESQSSKMSQEALSMSQLVQFNSYIKRRSDSTFPSHNRERETPLPLYVGLTIHAKTRSKDLVNDMFTLGLSVSYKRVTEVITSLGNRVCARYNDDGIVCPVNLRHGLFTVAAIDNIDHNPSATTSSGSFHGTGISLFQQPTPDIKGLPQMPLAHLEPIQSRAIAQLPEAYTSVPGVLPKKDAILAPALLGPTRGGGDSVEIALREEVG